MSEWKVEENKQRQQMEALSWEFFFSLYVYDMNVILGFNEKACECTFSIIL